MEENKNIRIIDIAKMAGVSIGTVDRVIHNRGRVSQKKLEKVKAILEQFNYTPNIIARSLVSKKSYKLIALIPSFAENEYWMYVAQGITKAAEEVRAYGVVVEQHHFNQYDKTSFDRAIEAIKSIEFDGIVIANFFKTSVITLSEFLNEKDVSYVYIDANIYDQHPLAYYGTNSYDSGAIAAQMMLERIDHNKDILVSKISYQQDELSNQVLNREKGFLDYLQNARYSGKIVDVRLKVEDPLYNFNTLDQIFRQHPNGAIAGAITFNSSCHILAHYLKEKEIRDIYLVGYDLIEKNRALLKEGTIKLLIGQRPELQGFNAIKALSNKIILGVDPERINFMPIDLLIKENVDYYKDF
ncbi:LacI family DNA-binding transcriptional regulator [Chitinophagaceae bacterium LB-8]|uniref:LacI family DNA-binding transcriptional regulator n=1 Tax=Paraflavisolibacter caeni TaxID=2982496 RepID=A0A9X3BEV2_9BACT|nr:LacI family DNA-binding transcriptional regulator [Paraflavisolibacter caeni]MCU7547719.1 LacI family DNA-binding transcriptional regulator [Paraflavisolibacter caeni]